MSAAVVVRIDSPSYADAPVAAPASEDKLHDLIHDVRQPLSSIEAIAYYLEMTLPAGQFEARQYMAEIQRLVADASAILERSVCPRKACARAAGPR